MDRGAWRATVQRVAQSRTRLKRFSTHAHIYPPFFRYPSHPGHHRTLSRVPCVIQWLPVIYFIHVCVLSRSAMSNSVTLWTVARQAPLSLGSPRQEYWSRVPFPSLGDLPNPGIKPTSPASPTLADGFFTASNILGSPSKSRVEPK